MMDKAVDTIESVADNAWVSWAGWLVPNIVHCIKEEVEARDNEEKEKKIHKEVEVKERLVHKEAKRLVKEEAEQITWREWHQQEKLNLFLSELITVEEFERDLEADGGGRCRGGWSGGRGHRVKRTKEVSTLFASQAIEEASSCIDGHQIETSCHWEGR